MEEQNKKPQTEVLKDKPDTKEVKKDAHTLKCEGLAKEYQKSYPKETAFHVTTDYQVFLGDNKSYAQTHQRSQGSGELVTIKVK